MAKRYFTKSIDKLPIIGQIRPVWTDDGDGMSHFVTSNEEVANGLRTLADRGKGGISEVTAEQLEVQKKTAQARQKVVEARRSKEGPFLNPGRQQGTRSNFDRQVQQAQSPQSKSPKKAVAVVSPFGTRTIEREPSVNAFAEKAKVSPPMVTESPVAEPVVDAPESDKAPFE